jgi:hypothetical protein
MAYGDDITEGIPYELSNPSSITTYTRNAESYDIAVNGQPFFLMTNDETPYRRETAPYRKQQIDQSNEPGEQSITGWWVRSQSSFHSGSGINYYDPSAGETVGYRFNDSKGVNVWDKGKVTLLNSCIENHVTTGAIASNGRPYQFLRSIKFNDVPAVLLHDEFDVDKVYNPLVYSITNKALTSSVATLTTSATHKYTVGTMVNVTGVDATFNGEYEITAVTSTTFSYAKSASNVTSTAVTPNGTASSTMAHFIDYNSGSERAIHAICDDGTTAYWVTNRLQGGNQRLTVKKKPLTEGKTTPAGTEMFHSSSVEVNNATMEYVKDRLVMAANNVVYEFSPAQASMPTAIYTHPSSTHVYTSIAASGPAIYLAGYNGIQSTIQKFTLTTTTGAMPVLTSAITAAEMPLGERVFKIFYYLGKMLIGTDKGIRVATVSDQDGSLTYGPLIVETTQPCYDFAARDHFVWCATSVAGEPGTIRIDLEREIEPLRFAYANDLYYDTTLGGTAPIDTAHPTTSCAFLNGTDDLAFVTAYASGGDGHVYREDTANLMSTGYVKTGKIRYGTLENKIFKTIKARIDNTNGGLVITSISSSGNEYTIGTVAKGGFVTEVGISQPTGSQESLSFKFTLSRSDTNATLGPELNGFQLKSLPAVPRQRLFQYPLACYDREMDSFGVQIGYENSAYDKLIALESTESAGDTIQIEDFRTGETYLGIIEQMQFINRTPSDKRFSGFGGILLLTIRTI